MEIKESTSGNKGHLIISGKFDFLTGRKFTAAYERMLQSQVEILEIDFEGLDYIDSSGLAVLLLLRKRADECNVEIVLKNLNKGLQDIFRIANFGRLFKIEPVNPRG